MDLPLRSPELIGSMHQFRDPRALVAARVAREERVGLEHRLEPLPRIASLVSDLRKLGKMGGDLAIVPREEDRLDVGEVLVRRHLRGGRGASRTLGLQRCCRNSVTNSSGGMYMRPPFSNAP